MPDETQAREPFNAFLRVERLTALTDGVFAIAMTVLALELVGTVEADRSLGELWPDLWPRLVAYVMSFLILGLFWVGHHAALSAVRATDRGHVTLNLLFLMLIAAIPFPAALVGTHPNDPWAFAVYGGALTLTAICLELSWWYASRRADDEGSVIAMAGGGRELGRSLTHRIGIALTSYAAAVALAFVEPWFGFAAFFASHVTLTLVPLNRRGLLQRGNTA